MILSLSSCIRSFVPNLEKYDELLVVDGYISDGPGPYQIRLSKSSRTQERSQIIPHTGCKVQVQDNLGNLFLLNEKTPGNYETDPSQQSVAGRTYKLEITTPDGKMYESDPEVLQKGLKIQSIDWAREHKDHPDLFFGRDGYQFYVDVETAPTSNNYLLWQMECTFKFHADHGISAYYDKKKLYTVFDHDTLRTCYQTKTILDIYLLNMNELQQTEIKHFPLHYEDNYTKALTFRYSLNVRQLTICESAFNYWITVKKIRDAGGELYTQQPFQVANNLKCISNPEQPVLGYFMVAGVSEKRVFLTPAPMIIRAGRCILTMPQMYPVGKVQDRPDLWPYFFSDEGNGMWFIDQECVDCRRTGTITKPSFWID